MGISKLLSGQPDKMPGWTSIPSRRGGGGGRNTRSRLTLQKPEISAGLMGLWLDQSRLGRLYRNNLFYFLECQTININKNRKEKKTCYMIFQVNLQL